MRPDTAMDPLALAEQCIQRCQYRVATWLLPLVWSTHPNAISVTSPSRQAGVPNVGSVPQRVGLRLLAYCMSLGDHHFAALLFGETSNHSSDPTSIILAAEIWEYLQRAEDLHDASVGMPLPLPRSVHCSDNR